ALDGPPLGSRAQVSADFRDQYYGLKGAIREGGEGSRLVTSGAISGGRSRWGEVSVRFGGQAWRRPVVDRGALDPKMAAWAADRSRPKLLVATQKRVLDLAVDAEGALLPVVPVISVLPHDPAELWSLAAAVASPPAAAWAAALALGTAL